MFVISLSYVGNFLIEKCKMFMTYLNRRYMIFWLVILSAKFSFAYFLQVSYNSVYYIYTHYKRYCSHLLIYYLSFWQIKPLVEPTRVIVNQDNIEYSWHDLVSRSKTCYLVLFVCASSNVKIKERYFFADFVPSFYVALPSIFHNAFHMQIITTHWLLPAYGLLWLQ